MIDKKSLNDVLLLQNKQIEKNITERDIKSKIEEYKDTPFIIIITGIRRGGKSTVLHDIRNDDCYYVNFDDERLFDFDIADFQTLYEALIELFGAKSIFIFDEIQNVKGWERFVRRLYNSGKKIYVTGSNSSLLSKEMGTHLTGRNIALELFPFNFREYLRYHNKEIDPESQFTSLEKSEIRNLFKKYLESGGFPEYLITEKPEYLKNLYENILYRDIIVRHRIRDEHAIKTVANYAASNIGKEISFNKLRKMTGQSSATTIKQYFNFLEDSYLIFLLPRFSYSYKKQVYYNKKLYFIDPVLAKIIGFRFSEDSGRILENTVFLNLRQFHSEIFFHKDQHECDFLVKQGNEISKAFQVCWDINDQNRKREIAGIQEAMQNYNLEKGYIITYEQEDKVKINGKNVFLIPAWKWLLEYHHESD
ncbi:MAG: ATP-binding protein [Candidatus Zixiibacteriota bacterium]